MGLVQSISWNEVKRIRLTSLHGGINHAVVVQENTSNRNIVGLFPDGLITDAGEKKSITVSGIKTNLSFKEQPSGPDRCYIHFQNQFKEHLFEFIYNQIDSLFGKFVTYEFVSQDEMDYVPTFLDIKISLLRFTKNASSKCLEEYFGMVPEQELVTIFMNKLDGELDVNSKMFRTQELRIDSLSMGTDVLFNFKGKKLVLKDTCYTDANICQFFEHWKSNANNLESIDLTTKVSLKSVSTIKTEIGIKNIPSGMSPQPIVGRKVACRTYISREDGIVAWIYLIPFGFCLRVQDFTEKQMFQKYNIEF
ncbi:unnamed protein product [Caenorhabditis brenneri]